MRVTSKGQVTIPRHIREQLGITPHSDVEFVVERGRIILRKSEMPGDGEKLVGRMRGRTTVRMTTDEILALTRDR